MAKIVMVQLGRLIAVQWQGGIRRENWGNMCIGIVVCRGEVVRGGNSAEACP